MQPWYLQNTLQHPLVWIPEPRGRALPASRKGGHERDAEHREDRGGVPVRELPAAAEAELDAECGALVRVARAVRRNLVMPGSAQGIRYKAHALH